MIEQGARAPGSQGAGKRRRGWLALIALLVVAFAMVAIPVILIRPFAPQSPASIALAFALRRWSPWVTVAVAVAGFGIGLGIWRFSPRLLPRIALVTLLLLILVPTWAARQNHFEWMFAPLPDARFIRAAEAGAVEPGDMVIAVLVKGDAAAYPVRQLAYHHLVEDAVGGVPIVATY
jgi:hypothetical protein